MFEFGKLPIEGYKSDDVPYIRLWRSVLDTLLRDYVGHNAKNKAAVERWLAGQNEEVIQVRDPSDANRTVARRNGSKQDGVSYVADMAGLDAVFVRRVFEEHGDKDQD